jgi:hypothetical protein
VRLGRINPIPTPSCVQQGITIPIPVRDDGVHELLGRLNRDRERVDSTDIEELEAEIDELVFDLFNLTEEERRVVEDYLEMF